MLKLKELDTVILCGGEGTRLRSVINDRPKPMAFFAGEPFLDILIRYAASFGLKNFLLLAGYKGDFISSYYRGRRFGARVRVVVERELNGTGGALKSASRRIKSDPFLLLNGDSVCRVDLKKFFDFHCSRRAFVSMAVARRKNRATGEVVFEKSGRIVSFREKPASAPGGWANTGFYLLERRIFSLLPRVMRFSLERDVFASLVSERCFAYPVRSELFDFGTPAGYRRALLAVKKGALSPAQGSR